MNPECNEARTYKALMNDPLCEVVPRFYREFEQNNEGNLFLVVNKVFAFLITPYWDAVVNPFTADLVKALHFARTERQSAVVSKN